MTGIHVPSIHFHLGGWAITSVSISLAFWINFFEKRNLMPGFLQEFLGTWAVERLDYVAVISGLIGLGGIFVSMWSGFVDATGIDHPNYWDPNIIILGYKTAMSNEILGFKVVWAFTGVQFFLFALMIRTYFVTINKEDSVFEQHIVVQLLYVESTLVGFFIMVVVAGAGGVWISGSSILTGVPILEEFLPGGNLMIPFFVIAGIFSLILMLSFIIKEQLD